jgi:Zn-dependent protease with chaperone function
MGGGALCVLAAAPLLLRHLWDTVPLPPGELRDRLQRMCEQHEVGVRDLLLWRTFGGMVNGAVMGFVGRVRYILLTDALLEALPLERVEAVMAHELAHVRRHHMFWLLIVAGSTMLGMQLAWGVGLHGAARLTEVHGGPIPLPDRIESIARDEQSLMELALLPALVCWFGLFGWVSRRFERQADTFAVQHLARERAQLAAEAVGDHPPPDRRIHVDPLAADAMISALQQVAELNHMNVGRPTFLQKLTAWRHGTIPWRQAYLRGLIGQPIDRLDIDRQVRWIKVASGAAFVFIAAVLIGPLSGQVGL